MSVAVDLTCELARIVDTPDGRWKRAQVIGISSGLGAGLIALPVASTARWLSLPRWNVEYIAPVVESPVADSGVNAVAVLDGGEQRTVHGRLKGDAVTPDRDHEALAVCVGGHFLRVKGVQISVHVLRGVAQSSVRAG